MYLLNQSTEEISSFYSECMKQKEKRGGNRIKEKESNHWRKKKTPASACLALYRCAAQIRHITEWKATRGGAAL